MISEMYGITYEQLYQDHTVESMRYIDIADKYGLSYWKVFNAIKKLGVPGHGMGPRPIPLETPIECYTCGKTYPWSPEYFMPCQASSAKCKQPCKACNVDRAGEWQTENRERKNAGQRSRYDPQKNYLKNQAWEKANPEKVREKTKRRRAVKKAAFSDLTLNDWQSCLEYWESRCAYCGSLPDGSGASELTQDHIIPLTRPDSPGHTLSNIIPACRSCNSSKYNRDMRDWLTFKFGQPLANEIEQKIPAYTKWLGERLLETIKSIA